MILKVDTSFSFISLLPLFFRSITGKKEHLSQERLDIKGFFMDRYRSMEDVSVS